LPNVNQKCGVKRNYEFIGFHSAKTDTESPNFGNPKPDSDSTHFFALVEKKSIAKRKSKVRCELILCEIVQKK
jgi:hypothetical protein